MRKVVLRWNLSTIQGAKELGRILQICQRFEVLAHLGVSPVGVVQLEKLDHFINERAKWASFYKKELATIPWISLPNFSDDYKHGWQSFVLLIDEEKSPYSRNKIMERLQEEGISTRPGTHAVHMLGFYKEKYNIQPQDYPGAQIANDKSISIPLHNRMVKEDFDYIVHSIKNIS